jgi:endo-1,4-beta-xylanase
MGLSGILFAMTISRRDFLRGVSAAGSVAMTGVACADWVVDNPLLTLKDAAAASGLMVGTAVSAAQIKNPALAELIHKQTNTIVADYAFKMEPMRPGPQSFNFREADEIADFARTQGLKLRGHTFVWHQSLPAWFGSFVTKENAAQVMTQHIATVGGRYAGRVHSWDVVNEAVELRDGRSDGLRESPWLKLLGPGYIDTAFRAARKADPKALLFYNEYDIEGEDALNEHKRKAVLTLLRGMLERDVPVDGLGIQSHLTAGHAYGPGVRRLVRQAHEMGLRVMLTELDVDDRELGAATGTRDAAVAETYAQYLRSTLSDGYVSGVVTWGLTDGGTWLNQLREKQRADGVLERPLPFDSHFAPKAAFVAQRRALLRAPRVVPVLRPRTQMLVASSLVDGLAR